MIQFFPRGKGPLVSVFICTRDRPHHLAAAIDSCYSLARHKNLIEYVIKVDDDDIPSIQLAERLSTILPVKIVKSPRGNGYADIHLWLTEMCKVATGDWFFLFNDDARMETEDWDVALLNISVSGSWHPCSADVCILLFETNGKEFSNESVVVRRKVFDILGHLSLSPYGDSWLFQVMDMVQSFARVSFIKINHKREEVLDGTRQETDRQFSRNIQSLVSFHAIRNKMADAEKLLAHIEKRMQEAIWTTMPGDDGVWYYYKPKDGSRGRHFLVPGDGFLYNPINTDMAEKIDVKELKGLWLNLHSFWSE